jgi:hypothetical protein
MKPLHNSYLHKEGGHFFQFQGSRAGLLKQLIYGGFPLPAKSGTSPIDKLLKDSALPPVALRKAHPLFWVTGLSGVAKLFIQAGRRL